MNIKSSDPPTREDLALAAKRKSLERSRKRVARELDETGSELRRNSLKLALAHLDQELSKLDSR